MVAAQHSQSLRKGVLRRTRKHLVLERYRGVYAFVFQDGGALAVVGMFVYWYIFIWRIQDILETHLQEHNLLQSMNSNNDASIERISVSPKVKNNRFILFEGNMQGQGSGNIVNGLLAAHMLGLEFDRIVCIVNYDSFNLAFQSKHPKQCEHLDVKQKRNTSNSITLVNFSRAPNECEVRDKSASDLPIIYFRGNTYPEWPIIPDNFFTRFYTPTERLKEFLPWKSPPQVVVHLRQADGAVDVRRGLDNATLDALGRTLPNDTFLVTNNVEWYKLFASKFGWRNPGWHGVRHSASNLFLWDKRHGVKTRQASRLTFLGPNNEKSLSEADMQDLQMWSDWYTILSAKKVYHTHSDFSLSAIHWMGIESKTIVGYDDETDELQLMDEHWQTRGVYPKRLVDRSPRELHNCGQESMTEEKDASK